ncbi:MAG: cytochrome c [Gammaproteobacteria bacterium]|nr:cytochrome c [Gammaproteobacteria bacterium]
MTTGWSMARGHVGAWRGTVLLSVMLALAAAVTARAQVSEPGASRQLFDTVCVACHTIGGGARIGPDLAGVTERRSAEWLRSFIRDPQQMRDSGDPVAAANLAQFGVPMPNLGLSEAQVEGLIGHLGGAAPAAAVRPRQFLPTLALAVLAAAGITLIALLFGRKHTETGA